MKLMFDPLKNIYLKHLHGFTLPEMLVTLAVVVILISMTAPSMQGLIINQRVTSATQEIFTSIHLARSEAIKQQRTVSLCSTTNGINCDEDDTGWEQGWLIFTDADADGILEEGDRILRASQALDEPITISWNQGGSVSFNSRGQADVAGTFEVCADGEARAVIISRTGRPRVEDQEVCS